MLHSRLSSVRPGLRKSNITAIYDPPLHLDEDDNSNYTANLGDCVVALSHCCQQITRARDALRTGSHDLPRIQKVVDHEKFYILVNERTVREYKADITEVIEPQIKELIERAEKGLRVLERRESSLQAKADTNGSRPISRVGIATTGMSKLEARRLHMLINQREKLEEELLALESDILSLDKRKPLSKMRR